MFYTNYVRKIDVKNRRLRNDFLQSKLSEEEFWKTVPNITFTEKYWYEVCMGLIKITKFLFFWRQQ
jgi:hypothetical protein